MRAGNLVCHLLPLTRDTTDMMGKYHDLNDSDIYRETPELHSDRPNCYIFSHSWEESLHDKSNAIFYFCSSNIPMVFISSTLIISSSFCVSYTLLPTRFFSSSFSVSPFYSMNSTCSSFSSHSAFHIQVRGAFNNLST